MAQAGKVITGVVVDPVGRPIRNARLYFSEGPVALPEIAALSDEAGRFSLPVPLPGSYTLECATDDGTEKVRLTVGDHEQTPITVQLTRRAI